MQESGKTLSFRKPLPVALGLFGTHTPSPRRSEAIAGRRTAPVRDDRR